MTTVRRALAISMGERYVLIGIALAGNMLLARLLTPEEIGIYSVSLAVIGLAQVMRDFGIGNFLIQEKNLNDAHIRTAFGISLLTGGLLFLVIFFGAHWAGSFYGETRMVETMRISALNFLVLPFCTISLALLRRDMFFAILAKVTLSAAVVGFAVMISLAYLDYGANSMAIGAVATNVVTGMGAWVARSDRKLLLPALTEWRALLNFGGQSALANIVTTISMDINDLAIGKILGFAPVAMISRAQGLMNLFHRDLMSAIRNVAYPAFAKAHREGEKLESRYVDSVTAVTVVAWPFYGFAALFSLEIIRLLFGQQWDEAARLVPIFCLAGAFSATTNLILNAILAVGRIDIVTKAEIVFQPLRAAIIVAAAIIFKSLMACAVAYLISFILYIPYIYHMKGKCIPNNYRHLLTHLWESLRVSLVALFIPGIISAYAGFFRQSPIALITLLMAGTVTGVCWVMALLILKHPLTHDPLFKRLTSKFLVSFRS